MRSDAAIRRLVEDLRPVSPLRPVAGRFALWGGVVLAVLGFEIAVAVARDAGLPGVTGAAFFTQLIVPLTVAVAAALAALQHSVPGRARPSVFTASWLPFVLWVGLLTAAADAGPAGSFEGWLAPGWLAPPAARCAAHVAASGVPGGLALFWLVRGGATLSGARAGMLIALAAGATGALATQLTCPNHSAAHLLPWHAGSVLAIAIAGIGMRRPLTAWSRPV